MERKNKPREGKRKEKRQKMCVRGKFLRPKHFLHPWYNARGEGSGHNVIS